jgi:hypothetical protein
VAAYGGNLLEQESNPDAFTWVEREGLRIVQQEKVAWAAVTLAEVLQEQGRPDRAFEVLEPLLDAVVNEELWLCAMQCQGEPAPRGLGDRGRLMDLYARYQAHLRTVALPRPTRPCRPLSLGGRTRGTASLVHS